MTDTELSGNCLTNSLTTVVFPEPEPPAIPMTNIIEGFDGTTGFDLPIKQQWIINKASWLIGKKKPKETVKDEPKIRKKGRLF